MGTSTTMSIVMPKAYASMNEYEIEFDGGMSKVGKALLIAGGCVLAAAAIGGTLYGIHCYKVNAANDYMLKTAFEKVEKRLGTIGECGQTVTSGSIQIEKTLNGGKAIYIEYSDSYFEILPLFK